MGLFDKLKDAAKTAAKQALEGVVTKTTPSQTQNNVAPDVQPTAEPVVAVKPQIEYTKVVDVELNPLANGEYEIAKFVGFEEENMEIPSEINGQRVVGIADGAFFQLNTLTNLKIAEGIRYIGERAFCLCSDLESVALPNTLEKMGSNCFEQTKIDEIHVPDSVVALGEGCFNYCTKLKKAILPDGLTEIPAGTFTDCNMLEEFKFPSAISIIGDKAFAGTAIIFKEIPQTLTVIGDNAFGGRFQDDDGSYSPVDEIRLPNTLTTIGVEGLSGLNCLKLIVPASVKSIGEKAFAWLGCVEDEVEVIFEDGCSAELPEGLFFNGTLDSDSSITSLTIPSTITVINDIFRGIDQESFMIEVKDEYGRQVYDEYGKPIIKWEYKDVICDTPPENLTIYCDPGSAAMKFAREKGINCAKREI